MASILNYALDQVLYTSRHGLIIQSITIAISEVEVASAPEVMAQST